MDFPALPGNLIDLFPNLFLVVLQFYSLLKKRQEQSRKDLRRNLQARRRRRRSIYHLIQILKRKQVLRSCQKVPELTLPDANHFFENSVPLFNENRFIKKFRVSRNTFGMLARLLRERLYKVDTPMNKAVSVEKRIAISLYTLKSNASIDIISDLFGVGRSTVPYILHEFCDAVNEILFDQFVQYPQTHDDKLQVAEGFKNVWQFPGCFGALDGTHIPIITPAEYPDDYYNYKSYHSIVMLALVDYNYKFMYVNIGRPGRVNDATVYADSGLKADLLNNNPHHDLHIVADGAFPLTMFLMKPYIIRHNMPADEENFNTRLSRARVVSEDAFGRLKGRWRMLMKRADFSLPNMRAIIKTCCVLHNICENEREPYFQHWNKSVEKFDKTFQQPHQVLNDRARVPPNAAAKRDQLKRDLYNDDVVILRDR